MENQLKSLIYSTQLPAVTGKKSGWPWNPTISPISSKMQNENDWPLISITIPSLNQSSFLEEAIRSVLLQGYPRFELFVMDGGSTDGSTEIIKKYSPWITKWRSEPDRGQSHAINKGWLLSKGDLIAYLPSDDVYQPNAFIKAAVGWSYQSDVILVTGSIHTIDADSNILQTRHSKIRPEPPVDLSTVDISQWYIAQQSSFFVREYLDKVGRWLREDLHYVMDRELMYRLCPEGRIIILEEPLASDRTHSNAKRQKDTIRMYREDSLALRYINFGDQEDKLKRERVAKSRLAQGYWNTSEHISNPLKKGYYRLISILNYPRYIKRFSLVKNLLPFGRKFRDITRKNWK
ncbi:MAG: hypothetical protein CL609_08635 [Anaerolineaceae bacterium]|nr:hypothetical protein [Anaerolineaceae bacterium]